MSARNVLKKTIKHLGRRILEESLQKVDVLVLHGPAVRDIRVVIERKNKVRRHLHR